MDLFDYMKERRGGQLVPLAARMRPESLDEVVGQRHILGAGKLLTRSIMADRLSSLIFFGPPGSGKTTIAKVIANTTKADFRQINATASGKKEMEEVTSVATERLALEGRRTILFIDEIHRFNKAQQDYLLPFVEDGTIILIGATTENPFFEVNRALVSRSLLFELKPLEKKDIMTLLKRAVSDEKKGMGAFNAILDDDATDFLADISGGDARLALNALELGILTTRPSEDGHIHITADIVQECIQCRRVNYDRDGDNHYDVISAFIKSMRGSDPDAAVYYLARMLKAGEDPKFIARRIMICAAEDVGMADPAALRVAVAADLALERVGLPEGRIPLAEAAIYVATAPKSNSSYMALLAAEKAVDTVSIKTVPPHLQDAHYNGAAELGRGTGYKYAHDFPGHYVRQQYLPDGLVGTVFFKPGTNGYENDIRKYMQICSRLAEDQG